jgi:hypothetical protein
MSISSKQAQFFGIFFLTLITGDVGERALREIYLKPFQIALKYANPWALMTS